MNRKAFKQLIREVLEESEPNFSPLEKMKKISELFDKVILEYDTVIAPHPDRVKSVDAFANEVGYLIEKYW